MQAFAFARAFFCKMLGGFPPLTIREMLSVSHASLSCADVNFKLVAYMVPRLNLLSAPAILPQKFEVHGGAVQVLATFGHLVRRGPPVVGVGEHVREVFQLMLVFLKGGITQPRYERSTVANPAAQQHSELGAMMFHRRVPLIGTTLALALMPAVTMAPAVSVALRNGSSAKWLYRCVLVAVA
jgi:hypothetical protein